MFRQKNLVLLCITTLVLRGRCADKYTDENRPYEFGFSIDGEQHRHEKKDENGIIMGEFGFITADGVYHVTVYATDENGGFKILSMKNIRVKPYPTAKTGAEKGRSLEFPPSPQKTSQKLPTPDQERPLLPQPQKPGPASPAKSCSHCSIPTTTTTTIPPYVQNNGAQQRLPISQKPEFPPKYDQNYQNYPQQNANLQSYQQTQQQQQFGREQQNQPQENFSQTQNYPEPTQNYNNYPQQNYGQKVLNNEQSYQAGLDVAQSYPHNEDQSNYKQTSSPGQVYPQSETYNQNQDQNIQFETNRSPKSYRGQSQQEEIPQYLNNAKGTLSNQLESSQHGQTLKKPQLISAQMQIVDKNTDIHYKRPGEKEGLPEGLNKDDMTNLLYTFNYTVGFHGHFEEGYTNGAKQGYYYVTGRNGVRTRIDYVADERGFHPKITQEVLDLLSDDVPKLETEKDPKYGLKGYEFKWIYYPVDSNQR